tara:strand:- start:435 stop:890 length:456 start_codon:yes stop_codon:yes gene_type:complete
VEGGPAPGISYLAGQTVRWEEVPAALSDSDPCSTGEVEFIGNHGSRLDVIIDAVTNRLGHPSLRTVPVHLEAIWILHIQVIGSDEAEGVTIGVSTNPLDYHRLQTGLRMNSLGLCVLNAEFVVAVCDGSHNDLLRFRGSGGIYPLRSYIIP